MIKNCLFDYSSIVEKTLCAKVREEFSNPFGIPEAISTEDLVEEAQAQVKQFRDEIIQYDIHHRADDLKPCKNYQKIADRIVERLRARLRVQFIHRANAYKVMFVMYLICHLHPPKHKSWWEKKFLEELPDYLEMSNYFKDTNCKHRLNVLLDELNFDNRLPLDVPVLEPIQKPTYPNIEPFEVQIFNHCRFKEMDNTNCLQYFNYK